MSASTPVAKCGGGDPDGAVMDRGDAEKQIGGLCSKRLISQGREAHRELAQQLH